MRPLVWIDERIALSTLMPARVLAWYPKAALGAGALEALISQGDGQADARVLKLVRLRASFALACPFCIDMNSSDLRAANITNEELEALQGRAELESVSTLSDRERLAIRYADGLSQTPVRSPEANALQAAFTERELVVLASTVAQVNYWGRLIQGLGIPTQSQCALSPGSVR
jgi:AhpD family alkylhydroperoxidase